MQIQIVIFQSLPQQLCKNIVEEAATAIHADFDSFAFQDETFAKSTQILNYKFRLKFLKDRVFFTLQIDQKIANI